MSIENKTTKILVIDDDETISSLIKQVFSKEGYEVSTANNGIDGEKIALEFMPDLIFMDVTMPGQDGYETTEKIKSNKELSNIPVVFLTGQAASEDKGRAFAKGGVTYMNKPFANQQLIGIASLILQTVNSD